MENSKQVINIDELIDDLIAACQDIYRHEEIGEAKKALTDVIGMMQDEIRWHREEKRIFNEYLDALRLGGDKNNFVFPTGVPNHRYLFEFKFITEFVDNNHPDGEIVHG